MLVSAWLGAFALGVLANLMALVVVMGYHGCYTITPILLLIRHRLDHRDLVRCRGGCLGGVVLETECSEYKSRAGVL